ncbi:crAss001_48 related protein [Peptostreptococcus faecalis]|uniref:crAss001_48 related protein n=1 Tax=Peptostreptococcus faecalis TaxID=2045015 RepID=UPI000C7C5778|nr:hypothetical protein [Peptostreptococcus faecalis]
MNYISRMRRELKELDERMVKITEILLEEDSELDDTDKLLLTLQHDAMMPYFNILNLRYEMVKSKEQNRGVKNNG